MPILALAEPLPLQPTKDFWPQPGAVILIMDTPEATRARCNGANGCAVCPIIYLPILPDRLLRLGYLLNHEAAHCLAKPKPWPGDHP